MVFLVDSDALVKITKAGLKETVCAHMDLRLAPIVVREVIDEGKRLGHPDAVEVELNVARRRLAVTPAPGTSAKSVLFEGGEADLVALYESGGYAAVISDDRTFLRKAVRAGIDVLTPAALLVFLARGGKISVRTARQRLEGLRPFVSAEEFVLAARELEKEVDHEGEGRSSP